MLKQAARRFPRTAVAYRALGCGRHYIARRARARTEPFLGWARRQPLLTSIYRFITRLRGEAAVARVPAERLLLGSDNGLTAADEVRLTGDLMGPSTPLPRWPHVRLLQQVTERGLSATSDELILDSAYGRRARRAIAAAGNYLGAVDDAGIGERGRRLVAAMDGVRHPAEQQHPAIEQQVRVRRVRDSDCFEVVSGHHRLATDYVLGESIARVTVIPGRQWTPLQRLLLDMSWQRGRRQLYQPVSAPELESEWVLVRSCSDRLAYMTDFLDRAGLVGPGTPAPTYLDVGSCYGWFVAQMLGRGFDARGIERDPLAPVLGQAAYCLDPSRILVGDCAELLKDHPVTDVVSCFSIVHHFVAGEGSCSAEELIARVSSVTGRVLFFETGESHESWLAGQLPNWTPQFIEAWLRRHTDFDEIRSLGTDKDAVPPFQDNYGRSLFVCVRERSR